MSMENYKNHLAVQKNLPTPWRVDGVRHQSHDTGVWSLYATGSTWLWQVVTGCDSSRFVWRVNVQEMCWDCQVERYHSETSVFPMTVRYERWRINIWWSGKCVYLPLSVSVTCVCRYWYTARIWNTCHVFEAPMYQITTCSLSLTCWSDWGKI